MKTPTDSTVLGRPSTPIVWLFFVLVTSSGAEVFAQSSTVDIGTRSARLAKRVMSPFCPGKTLYDCPSASATEMRLEMTAWMEDGASEDEIIRRLETRMPGFDFSPPETTSGIFWLSWLAATLFLLVAARRMVTRRDISAARDESAPRERDDEYERKLDDALRRESG